MLGRPQKGAKTLLKTRQWKKSLKKRENKMENKSIRENKRYRQRQWTTNISWLGFLKKRTERNEKVFQDIIQEIRQVTLSGAIESGHTFDSKLTGEWSSGYSEVTVPLCCVYNNNNTSSMTIKKKKTEVRPRPPVKEQSGRLQTCGNISLQKTAQ